MLLQASGEVRRVTRRDGKSKAGNPYTMFTVRLLTPGIDVAEVTIFDGGDVRVPEVGEHVAYDVEVEARGQYLSVSAVAENDTAQAAALRLAGAVASADSSKSPAAKSA